jgi:hypothetical protein
MAAYGCVCYNFEKNRCSYVGSTQRGIILQTPDTDNGECPHEAPEDCRKMLDARARRTNSTESSEEVRALLTKMFPGVSIQSILD